MRRFVLLVALGMALAGLSVGNGRAAYAAPWGQTLVVIGVAAESALVGAAAPGLRAGGRPAARR